MAEGGGRDSFIWENEPWVVSNSDNSGGSDENPRKKLPDSNNSTCPTRRAAEAGPSTGKKRSRNGKQGSGAGNEQGKVGGESDHEMHIWTERERRKKMRSMFANLHALLPQLPPKADKSTIVDEAINYIRSLQQTLQKLQKQKLERLHGVTTINYDSSMITPQQVAVDSREAFLAVQGSSSQSTINAVSLSSPLSFPRYPAMFRTWVSPNVVLNVCGDNAHINICCQKRPGLLSAICYFFEKHQLEVVSAQVSSDHYRCLYMIQAHASGALDQFPEALSAEEIFQQAAGEIMAYITAL